MDCKVYRIAESDTTERLSLSLSSIIVCDQIQNYECLNNHPFNIQELELNNFLDRHT